MMMSAPACFMPMKASRVARCSSIQPLWILQRHEKSLADHIVRFTRLCDEYEVADAITYRRMKLVSVDNAAKRSSVTLALCGLDKQVVVLREQYTFQFGRAV